MFTGPAQMADAQSLASSEFHTVGFPFDALPRRRLGGRRPDPEGLAFDGEGGLVVVETSAGRLPRIDLVTGAIDEIASGLAVGLAALPGVPPPFLPSGVTVDAAGAIYLTGDVANVVYRITRR